jgi:hypothetical protein
MVFHVVQNYGIIGILVSLAFNKPNFSVIEINGFAMKEQVNFVGFLCGCWLFNGREGCLHVITIGNQTTLEEDQA